MFVRDPYTDFNRCFDRILYEYERHKRLIIAVDFDDTIFNTHNNDGWIYDGVVEVLRRWQNHADIIVWTASTEDRYDFIRSIFERYNIKIAGINTNVPYIPAKGPKIYANVYLDDRSFGLGWAISALNKLAAENGF